MSPDSPGAKARRWPRRLAWAGGVVVALLVVAVATMDFWAPRAAEAWLGGVTFERRETRAGQTVEWTGLAWADDGVRLEAERVRVSAPWRVLRSGKVDAKVDGWELTVEEAPPPLTAAPQSGRATEEQIDRTTAGGATEDGHIAGWPEMVAALRRAGAQMERRVGDVVLLDGVLRAAGEEVAVDRLALKGAGLTATARARGQTVEIEGNLDTGAMRVRWVEEGVELTGLLGAQVARGELGWAGNTAEFSSEFVDGKWMPARLNVTGENWRVPAERFGLGQAYAQLAGDFVVAGAGEQVGLRVNASAEPRAERYPPLRVELAGEAEAGRARVERVVIEAPQAKARLSAPLEWRSGEGWSGEGEPVFAWEADLGALSGGALRGRTEGTARWILDEGPWRVRWDASGAGLAWREIAGASLRIRGVSDAETSTVEEAELRAADGSRLEARGRFVHATREIAGAVLRAKVTGALLRPWLPEGTALEEAEADLRADGAWPEPSVAGGLRVSKGEYSGWAADALEIEAEGRPGGVWRGELKANRGAAQVSARAELRDGAATVETFSLRGADGDELHAVRPVEARWAGEGRRVAAELVGTGAARVSVEWTAGAATKVFIQNVDTGWARDWRAEGEVPELRVRRVEAEGRVGAERVIEGAGSFDLAGRGARGEAWARGAGRLGAEGLTLERLEAGQGEAVLVEGRGVIPWRLRVGDRAAPEAVAGARWDFSLESRAGAEWWDELAKMANLRLDAPTMSVRVDGPAEAPRGSLALGAERVGLRGEGLPEGGLELRGLSAEATLGREEFVLRRLAAEVDGQRVEAEGRLPVGDADWARVRERPYVWLLDHAEARVRVPGAEVAALARYLPTLLAPQGTVAAELKLTPGGRLAGGLRLQGAATRPLGDFGVLQEVEVALALSDMEVRIEKMRATAGGQAVVVTGGARRVPGRMPELDLAVKAERFPLVRKPGLLLRGDLDLTVKTGAAGRTRVGGEVRLRDSLFLADIRPLLTPGGGPGAAAARARPPYFSVDTPPLADWELGLRVGGEEFLRLRTPIFEGTGSARFDLAGTLREPRAIGEFWVERGNILFPFATFSVQEGAVRLKASDPYTPVLDFRATGRRLGYDLRLELTGTANSPQLQLSSSPPLEAETLLLMVTAGAAPTDGPGAASSTQRLAAVGAYVGRDLLRTLGLGGTDEERLTVSSGEKVSRQGRETYEFEFKLNEKWSLTGEYDEFDAYNVGVKRRFGPGAREERARAEKRKEEEAGDDS